MTEPKAGRRPTLKAQLAEARAALAEGAKREAAANKRATDAEARAEAAESAKRPLAADPSDAPERVVEAAEQVAGRFGRAVKRLWKTGPKALVALVVLSFLGGTVFGGVRNDGHIALIHFATESAGFGLQAILLTLFALALVWLSQAIRSMKWYDIRGAFREMLGIQKRSGTPAEKPGDSIALGIQAASTTMFIAIVILAYFLIHDTAGHGGPVAPGQ